MRKSRVIKLISVVILIPVILTGCFSYNDINKVSFVTSVIFDIDDLGDTVVYLDCIKPYRSTNDSSDKGRRIIYKGTGKTALEAIMDLNMQSSLKFDFTQNRALLFTEKAARVGINKFLNLINNYQEFLVKPYMFVYYGDVKDLLEIASGDEEYLGLYLNDLVSKNRYNPRAMLCNINDYLSRNNMGSSTIIIGAVEIKETDVDKKVEVNGGSILHDSILIERIDKADSLSYNLLMNRVEQGTLEVSNPQGEEGFITLEILNSNVTQDIKYDNNKINITKNIEIKVTLGEAQGRAIYDIRLLDKVKEEKEESVKMYTKGLFNKYKNKDIDIFNVARLMEMHYPKKVVGDMLKNTELNVNVEILIDGSGTTKNSL